MELDADWGQLPEELAELILSKVPLVDLACVSTTSRTFQTVFRRELARGQKACCDRAVEDLGRERIITLVVLIDLVMKGEAMEAYMGCPVNCSAGCYLFPDGTCRKRTPYLWASASQTMQFVDDRVQFWVREETAPHTMEVRVKLANESWLYIVIPQRRSTSGHLISPWIYLDGVEGVALMQALLSEGLAQTFHDAGHQAEVIIVGRNTMLTQARFKNIIATLMPYITPCTCIWAWNTLEGVLKLP